MVPFFTLAVGVPLEDEFDAVGAARAVPRKDKTGSKEYILVIL